LVLSSLVLTASCASTPERTDPPHESRAEFVVRADEAASSRAPTSSATSSAAHASASKSTPWPAIDASASANAHARGPRAASDVSVGADDSLGDDASLFLEPVRSPNGAIAAQPEEPSESYPDRFMLRGGMFYFSKLRTKASADSKVAPVGATIDFNRTLGLDTSAFSGRVDSYYRFNDYHAIGASWYRFQTSGSRMIDKQVEWDGVTYPINAQVDTFFDQDIYKLNYRFSFYHNPDIEFGAAAGFNVQHFHVGLSSQGLGQSQSEALTAPLPVFGTFVNYNFTPRLLLNGEYEFFFLDFDKASGSLQDFIVALEYRIFKNMSFGGAFDFYTMNARYENSTTVFNIDQSWHAFMFYASIYF
jgi:hypothetical protein